MKTKFAAVFASKTRDEWAEIFSSKPAVILYVSPPANSHTTSSQTIPTQLPYHQPIRWWPWTETRWYNLFGLYATELDACVEPVLSMEEAIQHPHNVCVSISESSPRHAGNMTTPYFSLSLHLHVASDTIFTKMMIPVCKNQVSD